MKIVHRYALSLMGLARARLEGYGFDGLIDALASKNVPLLLRYCNPDRLLRVRSVHDGCPYPGIIKGASTALASLALASYNGQGAFGSWRKIHIIGLYRGFFGVTVASVVGCDCFDHNQP